MKMQYNHTKELNLIYRSKSSSTTATTQQENTDKNTDEETKPLHFIIPQKVISHLNYYWNLFYFSYYVSFLK